MNTPSVRRLRIAFDVDETLIPYGREFPVERSTLAPGDQNWAARVWAAVRRRLADA